MGMTMKRHVLKRFIWPAAVIAMLALVACNKPDTGISTAPEAGRVAASEPDRSAVPLDYRVRQLSGVRSSQRGIAGEDIGASLSYPEFGDVALDGQIENWIASRCPADRDSISTATPEGCMNQVLDDCLMAATSAAESEPFRCTFGVKVDVILNERGLLSLAYVASRHSSVAASQSELRYFNYDVENRQTLQIGDLINRVPELDERLSSGLRKQHGLQPNQSLADAGFFRTEVSAPGDVLIESQGLRFAWQSREIGPSSLGEPTLLLPWGAVEDLMTASSPARRLIEP